MSFVVFNEEYGLSYKDYAGMSQVTVMAHGLLDEYMSILDQV